MEETFLDPWSLPLAGELGGTLYEAEPLEGDEEDHDPTRP